MRKPALIVLFGLCVAALQACAARAPQGPRLRDVPVVDLSVYRTVTVLPFSVEPEGEGALSEIDTALGREFGEAIAVRLTSEHATLFDDTRFADEPLGRADELVVTGIITEHGFLEVEGTVTVGNRSGNFAGFTSFEGVLELTRAIAPDGEPIEPIIRLPFDRGGFVPVGDEPSQHLEDTVSQAVVLAAGTVARGRGWAPAGREMLQLGNLEDGPFLEAGDLTSLDDEQPERGFRRRYAFEASAGAEVSVEAESDDFDTYLILEGPDGFLRTDDDGGSGTNSAIAATLPETGRYTVVVTSFRARETGSYALRLATGELRRAARAVDGSPSAPADQPTVDLFAACAGDALDDEAAAELRDITANYELWCGTGTGSKDADITFLVDDDEVLFFAVKLWFTDECFNIFLATDPPSAPIVDREFALQMEIGVDEDGGASNRVTGAFSSATAGSGTISESLAATRTCGGFLPVALARTPETFAFTRFTAERTAGADAAPDLASEASRNVGSSGTRPEQRDDPTGILESAGVGRALVMGNSMFVVIGDENAVTSDQHQAVVDMVSAALPDARVGLSRYTFLALVGDNALINWVNGVIRPSDIQSEAAGQGLHVPGDRALVVTLGDAEILNRVDSVTSVEAEAVAEAIRRAMREALGGR